MPLFGLVVWNLQVDKVVIGCVCHTHCVRCISCIELCDHWRRPSGPKLFQLIKYSDHMTVSGNLNHCWHMPFRKIQSSQCWWVCLVRFDAGVFRSSGQGGASQENDESKCSCFGQNHNGKGDFWDKPQFPEYLDHSYRWFLLPPITVYSLHGKTLKHPFNS